MEDRLPTEHWTIRAFLFPGEWLCDKLNIEKNDNRMLARMYFNLVIYGKVAGTIAYLYAT